MVSLRKANQDLMGETCPSPRRILSNGVTILAISFSGACGLRLDKEIQRRYGYPTFIDATTGKNRPVRIIRSVERLAELWWSIKPFNP